VCAACAGEVEVLQARADAGAAGGTREQQVPLSVLPGEQVEDGLGLHGADAVLQAHHAAVVHVHAEDLPLVVDKEA